MTSQHSIPVLILIVVEDGLVPNTASRHTCSLLVLILIIVEDGLVLRNLVNQIGEKVGLNPYYSGRWSRTYLKVSASIDSI